MTRARGERGETEPTGLGGTPRRREESAGDSERTRLLAYFRQAPAAIAVTAGPEHVFEFINPAYLAAMGRDAGDAGELVGRPLRELFPALARQGVFEALDRCAGRLAHPVVFTLLAHRRDGDRPRSAGPE